MSSIISRSPSSVPDEFIFSITEWRQQCTSNAADSLTRKLWRVNVGDVTAALLHKPMESYITALLYRSPWAWPLLRLINAARLFPQGPSTVLRLVCNRAAVTSPTFTRVYASDCQLLPVHSCRHSVMEKINSSGTEDGERLIMELMITSHSHEFTQIMPVSYTHLTLPTIYSV